MARVSMWQLEGYPVTKLTRVDWDGMTMEWESGGPNLFYLSASVVIAFGGPRDATALMRDLVRLLGLSTARALHGLPLDDGSRSESPTRAAPVFDGDTVAPTESPPAPR